MCVLGLGGGGGGDFRKHSSKAPCFRNPWKGGNVSEIFLKSCLRIRILLGLAQKTGFTAKSKDLSIPENVYEYQLSSVWTDNS